MPLRAPANIRYMEEDFDLYRTRMIGDNDQISPIDVNFGIPENSIDLNKTTIDRLQFRQFISFGKTSFADTASGGAFGFNGTAPSLIIGIAGNQMDYNVTAANTLTVTGTIVAAAGTIGGFDIGADFIRDAANSFGLASTVTGGDDVRFWAGSTFAARATAPARITEAGAATFTSVTLSGTVNFLALASGSILTIQGWTYSGAFTSTDLDTVSWGAGTLTMGSGETFAIGAGSTGNMAAKTYIFFDRAVSLIAFQTTTVRADAFGLNRVLIAVAQNEANEASFIKFGDDEFNIDGAQIMARSVTATEIVADTITANEIAANTITGTEILTMNIAGKTATFDTGTIGGFTMSATTLSATNLQMVSGAANTARFEVGTGANLAGMNSANVAGDITFWGGDTFANRATAPFRVTAAGALTATSATITGSITATSGAIGGFTIAASTISATNLVLTSGASNTANITVGTGATAGGLNSAAAGGDIIFWGGDTFANRATAAFRVTAAGALTATSATITGSITATSGTIGGFTITATTIDATNLSLVSGVANTARITVGTGSDLAGMNSGAVGSDIAFWSGDTFANRAIAPFRVDLDGNLTTSSVTITGAGSTITGITDIVVADGGTGLSSGTSGGILGFTGVGTLASSVLLTANALMLGGGAGATPIPMGSLGTVTTVLHGNAAGAPTFGAVVLTTDVSGTLPIANGGTANITALAAFNALSPVTTRGDLITRDATNNIRLGVGGNARFLRSDGTDPSWGGASFRYATTLGSTSVTNTVDTEQTITSWTITGGDMGTTGVIKITFNWDLVSGGSGPTFTWRVTYGGTTFFTFVGGSSTGGTAEIIIANNASASAQNARGCFWNDAGVATAIVNIENNNTGVVASGSNQTLAITGQMSTAASDSTMSVYNVVVELIN